MKRRTLLAALGAAGIVPATRLCLADGSDASGARDYYELRRYEVESPAQQSLLDAYLRDAAIPAWNRLGVRPVGVFLPQEGTSPLFVLLRHKSLEALVSLDEKLLADADYVRAGAALLDAPAETPAFRRMESSLMLAFRGMPELETPAKGPGRVLQLRTYESPSVKTGLKKIEMFNDAGEIAIFRRVGLNPVFFGQTLVGAKMPNLTYMLAFDSMDQQQAAWQKFRADPQWLDLRAKPEYSDKAILCGITNLFLKAAEYSQI